MNCETIDTENPPRVADVMQRAVVTVKSNDKMMDVAIVFHQNRISAAPVVDEIDRCVGVLTTADFIRYFAEKTQYCDEGLNVSDVKVERSKAGEISVGVESFELVSRHMTMAVQSIDPNESALAARKMMLHQRIHHLFVLDQSGHVQGVVSSLDLL